MYISGSLCAQILRVRYETLPEWRGLIKAQQETVRVENYDPQVIATAFERGQKAGNRARRVVQVKLVCFPSKKNMRMITICFYVFYRGFHR